MILFSVSQTLVLIHTWRFGEPSPRNAFMFSFIHELISVSINKRTNDLMFCFHVIETLKNLFSKLTLTAPCRQSTKQKQHFLSRFSFFPASFNQSSSNLTGPESSELSGATSPPCDALQGCGGLTTAVQLATTWLLFS